VSGKLELMFTLPVSCSTSGKVLKMDVSKYLKEKNLWIFEDTFDQELKQGKLLGNFVKAKDWLTNSNKKVDVFVLSINATDYMIMPFNVDYTDFVEVFGTDTEKWESHQFNLTKNKKNKYVMECIEENI